MGAFGPPEALGGRLGLHDLVADSVANDVGRGVEVKLAHQVGAVRLGGLDADPEQVGNFFGGLALRDELDYFALARSQRRAFLRFGIEVAL